MSDEDFQGQPAGTEGTVEPQEHSSPWAQYLEPLPESVRPLVEPTFKQWDADVTQRFQKVQSEYAPLKDFQPLFDQGFTPDVAGQAFNLMQALNDDPEAVLRELAEAIGYDLDQGTQEPDEDDNLGEYVDPRLQSVEQMTEAMAEILLAQERQQQEAAQNAELDAHLTSLREKHGDYDEEYVLTLMGSGLSGEQAIAKYHAIVGKVQAPVAKQQAPRLLGAGGGLPSEGIDVSALNSSQTKDLVAQMLAQAAQQG